MKKDCWKKKVPGFSLLETSMVLVIAGVMFGAVFKGKTLLDQSKIRATAYEFSRIQTALSLYSNTYSGNIFASLDEVWKKLAEAELIPSQEVPTSKLGGAFAFVAIHNQIYLKLGKGDQASEAFLTSAQASSLAQQLKEGAGPVLVLDSSGKAADFSSPLPKQEKYTLAVMVQR